MTNLDFDRITHPLRLAKGSHRRGSGKGCAMNVISYINGDVEITDYPECSARPLSDLVQTLNDELAEADGFLSPENSLIVLDLGFQTVGTAGVTQEVVWRWLADLLVDPQWGVVKYATPDAAPAIRGVAELCVRAAGGEEVSTTERRAAYAAAADYAAVRAAVAAAMADAGGDAAADTHINFTRWAIAHWAAGADAATYAAVRAAVAVAMAPADTHINFTRWAIARWRELAGLDQTTEISRAALDTALTQAGAFA